MMNLSLKKEIYNYSRVLEATHAYVGIADIEIEEQNEYWKLIFDKCKYDERCTIKEFENYLIGVENT